MARQYTKQEIEKIRKTNPTFRLSKSEALKYAASMGASDSLRGLQQIGAKFFGADEAVEKLKERDRKLQSILDNKEYGNAAMGTFLASAVIADPIGWIPIIGTVKKAKNIYDLGKYGAMAGGFHSGIGYVSEDRPGLIGEKQSRLENTLIGVGAGATLGAVTGGVANAIQLARGKPLVYGLTKDIKAPKTDDIALPRVRSDEDIAQAKRKTQEEYYAGRFGADTPPTKAQQQEEYYKGRFSKDPDKDKAIDTIVKENSIEGPKKPASVLKFYQDMVGNRFKDLVFNNAGTSLVGFGAALGGYNSNDDPNATMSEKLTTSILIGLSAGAGVNMVGRIRHKNDLVSEKMARLFIDDYGLTDEYKILRRELQVNKNSIAGRFLELAHESQQKLTKDERKIFYNLMTGDLKSLDNLTEEGIVLSAKTRDLITEMGQKYVDNGLLSRKVFLKNAGTYLHRSYQRGLSDPKTKKSANAIRDISIIGDNLKPRGDIKTYTLKDYNKRKDKLTKQGFKILDRTKKDNKTIIKVRRNYTKEERIEMGEIEDLSFAIAETGRLMANDISTATFFSKIAKNKNFTLTKEQYINKQSPSDFVLVPKTTIKGTNQKQYGTLAGKYIHEDVFNDITRMYKINTQPKEMQTVVKNFDKMQRVWKLSKTAWNPAVHLNNTVSNFVLLDFSDTSIEMLVKSASEFKKGNKSELLQLGKKYGIFDVDVISRELTETRTELGSEVMKGLGKIADVDKVPDMVNYSNNIWKRLSRLKKATLGKMEDAYQFEDQVFRLAVFMDRIDKGVDVNKAAMEAKKWFINYDINAPAINALKRTVVPFISYTYRVIPLLAEAAILRPHKLAKWAAIGYGLNEVGKHFGGGNEELERVTMREELSKKLYSIPFAPPRMIKLGWRSEAGDAQYIDVQRFIPGGDIFEQREGEGFKIPGLPAPLQPGGLLVDMPLLFGTQRNPFTGQDIEGLGIGKDKSALFSAVLENLTPNIPGLPGSYATKKIKKAINIQEGEPYYNVPGSKYAAKYSPLEAIAYGLGVKLRPQNIRANRELKEIDYQSKIKKIDQTRSQINKQFRNGVISTVKERDEKLAELEIYRLKLAAEWQVYERKLNEARAKDVVIIPRKKESTGGLIEGEYNVPFTKENPADRVNSFTGLPYQQADLTAGGVLVGLLRDRIDRVPKAEGGEEVQEDNIETRLHKNLETDQGIIKEAIKRVSEGNPNAEKFIKGIAKVETRTGKHPNTFYTKNKDDNRILRSDTKSIFSIDRIAYRELQRRLNPDNFEAGDPTGRSTRRYNDWLQENHNINLRSVSFNDLNRPIIGAAAARAILKSVPESLPVNDKQSARQWSKYWNKSQEFGGKGKGTMEAYLTRLNEYKGGLVASSLRRRQGL